jgi:NADPH:quinone reductase-like Zn-dependent oxidoreductase
MKAARIHQFGPPEVVVIEELPRPNPSVGELLVRVQAAGVAPWDAIIREGKSKVSPKPPLTLGSDLSGVVEAVGDGVTGFRVGQEVYGVTNAQFCGAHAEYAIASASMVGLKPQRLSHLEAASAPVIAVTAWQMLFDYAKMVRGQSVLILGAAGNVGAFAVQLAKDAGLRIATTAAADDYDFLRKLGAETVADYRARNYQRDIPQVDVILDLVGGASVNDVMSKLKPEGILVSVVSTDTLPQRPDARSVFFYAEVTTARLAVLTKMFDAGMITPRVGSVLPLVQARQAHYMLAGAPHEKGKIVLDSAR